MRELSIGSQAYAVVKFAFCKMYFLRTECNHLNREKWKQMIVVNSAQQT